MTTGSILLSIALFLVVALFLARPFLEDREEIGRHKKRRRARRARRARLQEEKEAILAEIRQLDFDHETGKLPAEQHKVEREQLKAMASKILRQIDILDESAPARAVKPAEKVAGSDEEIEAAIARRRTGRPARKVTPAENGQVKFCPQCGERVDAGDRFCAACGYNLSERMTANTAS